MGVPCVADPAAWDLDQRGPVDWLRSMALCAACPLLEQCRAPVDVLPARPRCLIWAGIAYGHHGEPLTVAQVAATDAAGRARGPTQVPPTTVTRPSTMPLRVGHDRRGAAGGGAAAVGTRRRRV